MSANIMLEIERRQTIAARETLEAWSAANHGIALSIPLDELLRRFLDVPNKLKEAECRTFESRPRGSPLSYDALEELRQLFDEEIRLLQALRTILEEVRSTGRVVDSARDLDRVLAEATARRERLFAHWEPFTKDDERQALEDIAKGTRFPELDDAMAQIAGMDKESWLRKVQEYAKTRERL
jgi:hypothetical protein